MEFEWDPDKDAWTFQVRGLSFAYAIRAFLDPDRLDEADVRRNYGEIRRRVIALIDEDIYVVIYTFRGDRLRIISARRARRDEKRTYSQGQAAS